MNDHIATFSLQLHVSAADRGAIRICIGHTLMALVALLIAIAFGASTSFGASFNCRKAQTPTEKEICADDELADLDERMARVYARSLSRVDAPTAEKIRTEQRLWVAERDNCSTPRRDCLLEVYTRRVAALEALGIRAEERAQRSAPHRPESAKFEQIMKFVRSHALVPNVVQSTRAECERAMADLKSGSYFKAIEPLVRADSDKDPRLEKWHRCDKADEWTVEDRTQPYLGFYTLGAGPYRYYQVDLDGNVENGPEDVIYWAGDIVHRRGAGGYAWVNIAGCSFKGRAELPGMPFQEAPKPGEERANLLVQYRNEILALELTPLAALASVPGVTPYSVSLGRLRYGPGNPRACVWQFNAK